MYDRPVAIPGGFYSGQVFFPKDGVLARTVSLEMERGRPASRRRLETQVLHFDGEAWRGYTYQWNDAQTDATLVPAAGLNRTFTITDAQAPGGHRRQTWHFPSRAECLTCHNPWAGHVLAFTLAQLNKDYAYGSVVDNQLRTLEHVVIITRAVHPDDRGKHARLEAPPRLTDPYDPAADLDRRARSYLHVNCSHCHQFGAGGTADIELRADIALEQTKTLEVRPVQGPFGIPDAQLLAPGDPYRSVLYYRMAKQGPGRMPHTGSEIVDEQGLRLVHDWIRRLPVRKDERALIQTLRSLDEPAILARERDERDERLERLAGEIARSQGREEVTGADRKQAEVKDQARAAQRVKQRAAARSTAISKLLSSTTSALLLAHALDERRIPASVRPQVLAAATACPEAQVRDLFERFVPDEQRVQRLGTAFKPEEVLARKGDVARGKELFFKAGGLQCVNCHRINGTGSTLGPELSQVGKKYDRAQLLAKLLEPSKNIDPKYVPYVAQTADGQVHTGLLVEKTPAVVVLKTAADKEVRLDAKQVEALAPQAKSLMPEFQLRDLTAAQAADLLEYLASLK
jgi:putative heme-binding domain-containing protein